MSDAIRVHGLTKRYRRVSAGFHFRTLKSALLDRSLTAGLADSDIITALDDVTFTVDRGESFGIIGGNGSGKSTLLKCLAQILPPSEGTVSVDGRLAALIELGAGFHPEISGRENVFINGAILGMDRKTIARRLDDIVAFSGLEDFIDEPVKNYSSGMYVRLGFAIAIHTDPDILLVDEVLAVGDEAFGHKCLHKIEELLARGVTVIMVSHSLDLIEDLADRVLWLDRGEARLVGSPRRVIDAYRQEVARQEEEEHRSASVRRQVELDRSAGSDAAEAAEIATETTQTGRQSDRQGEGEDESSRTDEPDRWGSRIAEIHRVRLLDGNGQERFSFAHGEPMTIEISTGAKEPLTDFVFGVSVHQPRGVAWGTNTDIEELRAKSFEGQAVVRVVCPSLELAPGTYSLDVAVHSSSGVPYDYLRRVLEFRVTDSRGVDGVYSPRHSWQAEGGIEWEEVV